MRFLYRLFAFITRRNRRRAFTEEKQADEQRNMSQADLGVLRTAKTAMDEGLIAQSDFDVIKLAFLKAQQIKAGMDAGMRLPSSDARCSLGQFSLLQASFASRTTCKPATRSSTLWISK